MSFLASAINEPAFFLNQLLDNPTYGAATPGNFLSQIDFNLVSVGSPFELPSHLNNKVIRKENIRMDIADPDANSSLQDKPTYKEIGRGHFAIVYKGRE